MPYGEKFFKRKPSNTEGYPTIAELTTPFGLPSSKTYNLSMRDIASIVSEVLYRILPRHARVIVATSGGPDSQALLHLVASLREKNGISAILAVGVDHGLRLEARDELGQAEALAKSLDLPFKPLDVHVSKHGNLLEQARNARYEGLESARREFKADAILVGHTATDQLETILMRLARGTGPEGIGGIPEINGYIMRPLLSITRNDTIHYSKRHDIAYAMDPSNQSSERARSRIRMDVLPTLRSFFPRVETHAQRFSQLMSDESAYLDQEATARWAKLRGPLDSLSTQVADIEPVLGRRIVRKWLKEAGMAPDFETVEQLLQVQTPTKISVGGKVLESTCGFWWVTSEERLKPTTLAAGAPVDVPEWQHAQLRLDVIGQSSLKEYSDGNTVTYFDAAEIEHPINVRGFNPGDRFQPFGLSGSQKLKKLFIDRKIPAPLRLHWPIIECNGKILWVVGLRRSDYAPISNTTTEVIRLELIGRVPWPPYASDLPDI